MIKPPKSISSIQVENGLSWKNALLEEVQKKMGKNGCRHKIWEFNDFPPNNIQYYHQLQKEIAKLIPNEENRPSIILHIRGNNRKGELNGDCGYLGGTGPISDAQILSKVIGKAQHLENFSADLFSMPPPRGPLILHLIKNSRYIRRMNLRVFKSNRNISQWFLCSNTAHINFDIITQNMRLNNMDMKKNKVDHLVDHICQKMSRRLNAQSTIKPKQKNVLILGTRQANKKKLYPNRMEAQENINGLLPSQQDQMKLQNYIDKIKRGDFAKKPKSSSEEVFGEELGIEFTNFIKDLYQKYQPDAIAFTCTELPYLLHKKDSEGTPFFNRLNAIPVPKIDSEAIMVKRMVHIQNKLSNQSARKADKFYKSSIAKKVIFSELSPSPVKNKNSNFFKTSKRKFRFKKIKHR